MPQKKSSNRVVAMIVVLLILLLAGAVYLFRLKTYNQPGPVACTMEAKLCPDGSYVGRSGPRCEFTQCPEVTIDSSWKTATDTVAQLEFRYPEKIDANYISAQEWPPKITVTSGSLVCQDASGTSSLPEQATRRLIGGRDYCVKFVAEGAAGTIYTTYDYTTQIGDKLITMNFTLRYPQCYNYDNPAQTNCQKERETFDLDGLVGKMISSLKFN